MKTRKKEFKQQQFQTNNLSSTQKQIVKECNYIRDLLLEKNDSYGDSFSQPVNIMCKGASPDMQIRIRIDDKLSRLMRGKEYADEDSVKDLIGYLVLLRVLENIKRKNKKKSKKR